VHSFRLLSSIFRALLAAALLLACLPAGAARTALVFGDSLSAAYGLRPDQGWVSLFAERARRAGLDWRVVNASVSGETTAGGLRRLPEDLKRHKPDLVVIALGANDALRGQPVDGIRANLERMVRLAREAGAQPVLVGIMIPPNYGIDYTQRFRDTYPAIASNMKVTLVPFLLEGVAGVGSLNQSDMMHPTAKGQERMADVVWKVLAPVLRRAG
jgi:acyl-CoA thioesterase-1